MRVFWTIVRQKGYFFETYSCNGCSKIETANLNDKNHD